MLEFGFYNMDCMEGMKEFPNKYFDLAIVDPPYERKDKIINGGGWAKRRAERFSFKWDKKPDAFYFEELRKTSKNQIILGGNNFTNNLPESNAWIIWDKVTDGFTAVVPELAWTSFDRSCKMFRYPHGESRGFRNMDFGNIHPTEKPVALYRWLLQNYAKQGDKILDTHVGSASSLIAFEQEGFDYVGFELDKDYFRDATKRIKQARTTTIDMFKEPKIEDFKQENLF